MQSKSVAKENFQLIVEEAISLASEVAELQIKLENAKQKIRERAKVDSREGEKVVYRDPGGTVEIVFVSDRKMLKRGVGAELLMSKIGMREFDLIIQLETKIKLVDEFDSVMQHLAKPTQRIIETFVETVSSEPRVLIRSK